MLQQFLPIFGKLFTLFLIVGVGYFSARVGIIDRQKNQFLTDLVIKVTFPAMVLASALTNDSLPSPENTIACVVAGGICYLFLVGFMWCLVKVLHLSPKYPGTITYLLALGNTGFMGVPVCQAVFGNGAILYASLINMIFNVIQFTICTMLVIRDSVRNHTTESAAEHKLRVFDIVQPALLSCVAALVLALMRFHMEPNVVTTALASVGNITTPGSLMVVGASMGFLNPKELLGTPRTILLSCIRLLLAPLVIFLLFFRFISDPLLLQVIVSQAAMPAAALAVVLSVKYNTDSKTTTQVLFWTNVLCVVTIPLLLSALPF